MTDILEFWAGLAGNARVHPADRAVLDRANHSFDLDCLPAPFTGPLKTARVVLLFLSPGLDGDGFDQRHARSAQGQQWYLRQRSGLEPMPDADEHNPHYHWWTKKVRQFGLTPNEARHSVAILDLAPYHSVTFSDWHMLSALPSSRASLDWAQSTLFEEAMAGERIVICMRSADRWGLRAGRSYGEGLFAPECTRGGFMLRDELRNRVVSKVRNSVRPATID